MFIVTRRGRCFRGLGQGRPLNMVEIISNNQNKHFFRVLCWTLQFLVLTLLAQAVVM